MKDQRYKAIKSLIESKNLTSLKDVFTILPYSIVRLDMKMNYNTLRRRVDGSESLTMKDIILLADLFEVPAVEVFKLSFTDISGKSRPKKKGG